MIKASELRIGNWLFDKEGSGLFGKVVCVDDVMKLITCEIPQADYDRWDFEYDKVSPIPITPSILEACGFELYKARLSNKEGIVYLKKREDKLWIWLRNQKGILRAVQSVNLFFVDSSEPFQYLHQLQNLYFALTGEELVYIPIKELT